MTVHMFVSYRRDSDEAFANLLRMTVGSLSGVEVEVYLDTQERAGVTWPERIREAVRSADVVVAIIGSDWLSATDAYHRRRIDQDEDWVRQELEMALAGGAVVIPLLVDGAEMPPASALPSSLAPLADRLAINVRTPYLQADAQPLFAEIERLAGVDGSVRAQQPAPLAGWPYPDPPLLLKPAPLSEDDLDLARDKMIPEWKVVEGPLPEDPTRTRVELKRELRFRSFLDVLAFMGEIGKFCDASNHHPRWENVYRTLWISLSTWDIGLRVSNSDVTLALFIDKTYSRYLASTEA